MLPVPTYQSQPPEFWALVKLVSQLLGYSVRKTKTTPSRVATYKPDAIKSALADRHLDGTGSDAMIDLVASYSVERARLMEQDVRPNLMDREEAREAFETVCSQHNPPAHLISMNKQKGEKRHEAYLASIVSILTWQALVQAHGEAVFDPAPRGPLTFSHEGMPLRTLFRWMDGAFPSLNHPHAAWEIKEYYGTTTFGSRVADGVYETALDGYELNDLRTVGVDVKHYLFLDDRWTWWDCGKSYVCRIVDMLHVGLLDGAFFGREVLSQWTPIVAAWPKP
ncbi:MAG: DUF7687 domain-containing protein [Solirubrobacteraceae bacterium]